MAEKLINVYSDREDTWYSAIPLSRPFKENGFKVIEVKLLHNGKICKASYVQDLEKSVGGQFVSPETKLGKNNSGWFLLEKNTTMQKVSRKKIDEVVNIVKKIQELTGRKVLFKEASGEAEGNKIVDELQKITDFITNTLSKDRSSVRYVNALTRINILIQRLIQEETQHVDHTTPIEEDVDMDIDQITQEPDVVKKLNDKNMNINLVDKKHRDSAGSSSYSSTSSTY